MWKVIVAVGAISIVRLSQSAGILQVAPTDDDEKYIEIITDETEPASSDKPIWSKQTSLFRRAYKDATRLPKRQNRRFDGQDDDREDSLKHKISILVQTTMHDTNYKMKFVNAMKEKYKEDSKYKIGFILVMIKKSREVLNELFNVAVKHRDQWKVLEQLKIFELIVHTNVDTTHLVRQLMEHHMEVKNSTEEVKEPDRTKILRTQGFEPPENLNFMIGENPPEQPMGPPYQPGPPGLQQYYPGPQQPEMRAPLQPEMRAPPQPVMQGPLQPEMQLPPQLEMPGPPPDMSFQPHP